VPGVSGRLRERDRADRCGLRGRACTTRDVRRTSGRVKTRKGAHMRKLASTLGSALILLCGGTIGADVQHATKADRRSLLPSVAAGPADAVSPAAAPPSAARLGSCVVPQTTITGVAVADRLSAALAGDDIASKPAAQVSRNDKVDATFEVRQRDDGRAEVVGKSGDLQISKIVTSDGSFVLDLAASDDHVSIAASGQGTTITRNGARVSLPRSNPSDARSENGRRLLAGSKALLQFRRIGAGLVDAEDRSGPALAIVIADAAVGQLTGDVGAVRRAARYLAHSPAANTRPVALRPECFQTMESDMMFALNDYASCLGSVWGNLLWEDLCAWRWLVEVESMWFTFIGCSGLGRIF
jgi:hypothetical protein